MARYTLLGVVFLSLIQPKFCQNTANPDPEETSSAKPATSGLLIVGGNGGMASVEEIHFDQDVEDNEDHLANYPMPISDAAGVWDGTRAVVCGGACRRFKKYYKACFSLVPGIGNWSAIASMPAPRMGAAAVAIGSKIFISGGETQPYLLTKSTILLDEDTWTPGPDLPMSLADHCAVQIDDKTTLISGGRQGNGNDPLLSRRSWLYDWNLKEWREAGPMTLPRIDHACALVSAYSVGAIGGKSSLNAYLSSEELEKMEIFDVQKETWSLKNQPLPVIKDKVLWGSTFTNVNGHLLLLGGSSLDRGPTHGAFEYSRHFGFKWVDHQQLSIARRGHVAIPLGGGSTLAKPRSKPDLGTIPDLLVVGTHRRSVPKAEIVSFQGSAAENGSDGSLLNFPTQLMGAVGEVWQGNITLCGGLDIGLKRISSQCLQWDSSEEEWNNHLPNLALGRKGAASLVFQGKLWVLGGESRSQLERTTEILAQDGSEWTSGPRLPFSLSDFCTVKLDEKSFLVIGGTQWEVESNGLQSRHVWLYNSSNLAVPWTELAPLHVKRMNHACGTFQVDGKTRVIVAGGKTGDRTAISSIKHIEWFDLETNLWTLSNHTVGGSHDFGLVGASMVQTPSRLFLVGGQDLDGQAYPNIYEYDQDFGFYDVESMAMESSRYDFVVLPKA